MPPTTVADPPTIPPTRSKCHYRITTPTTTMNPNRANMATARVGTTTATLSFCHVFSPSWINRTQFD
jgi:hypothetical protein